MFLPKTPTSKGNETYDATRVVVMLPSCDCIMRHEGSTENNMREEVEVCC